MLNDDTPDGYLQHYASFFSDAVRICDEFKIGLLYNRPTTSDDATAFDVLISLVKGITTNINNVTATVLKHENDTFVRQVLSGPTLQLRLDNPGQDLSLFDTNISTWPYTVIGDASVVDAIQV